VGMSDGIYSINPQTANGPRVDWVMKPDLIAPGTSLTAPSLSLSGSTTCTGTSCSAPLVSGGIAVILSALRQKNISYTPGTIKAALIEKAIPLTDVSKGNEHYPWWQQGAGLVNFADALDYILSNPKTSDNIPNFVVPYPKSLPFHPISTLFQGQTLGFNLTLISSPNYLAQITVENDNLHILLLESSMARSLYSRN